MAAAVAEAMEQDEELVLEDEEDISAWLQGAGGSLAAYVGFCSAGEASQPYIMGGDAAEQGEWRSAVAIYRDNKFSCGGTVASSADRTSGGAARRSSASRRTG